MEAGLIATLGSVGVLFGYMVVKKLSRSRCHSDSGCIQCDSPAVELAKENTKRLDNIAELIMQLSPTDQVSLEVKAAATKGESTI